MIEFATVQSLVGYICDIILVLPKGIQYTCCFGSNLITVQTCADSRKTESVKIKNARFHFEEVTFSNNFAFGFFPLRNQAQKYVLFSRIYTLRFSGNLRTAGGITVARFTPWDLPSVYITY